MENIKKGSIFFTLMLTALWVSISYAAPRNNTRTHRENVRTNQTRTVNRETAARTADREAAINQDDLNVNPDVNNGNPDSQAGSQGGNQTGSTGSNFDQKSVAPQFSGSNSPAVPPNNFATVSDQTALAVATGDPAVAPAAPSTGTPSIPAILFEETSVSGTPTFGTADLSTLPGTLVIEKTNLQVTVDALFNNLAVTTVNDPASGQPTDIKYGDFSSATCVGSDCPQQYPASLWIAGATTASANLPTGSHTYNVPASLSGLSSRENGQLHGLTASTPFLVQPGQTAVDYNYFTINFDSGAVTGRICVADSGNNGVDPNRWDSGALSGQYSANNTSLSITQGRDYDSKGNDLGALTGTASLFVAGTNGEYVANGFTMTDGHAYVAGTQTLAK